MELYQGIILGVLQGMTEFLPISSSGHLVLGQLFFELKGSHLVFDVSVHLGTLFAVLVVYFSDIKIMVAALLNFLIKFFKHQPLKPLIKEDENLKLIFLIFIGCIPTALIGLCLKQFENILFTSKALVGSMLIITGTILYLSKNFSTKHTKKLNMKNSFLIGIVQGLAVIPGISRSGTTIAAGMFAGLNRKMAAKFSFLLSIPAITGAQFLSIKDVVQKEIQIDFVIISATFVSFVTGLIALKLLLKLLHSGKFHLFAFYCWFIGLITLII